MTIFSCIFNVTSKLLNRLNFGAFHPKKETP